MPVVRTIYNALKQILETVLQSKSEAFRQVVLLEYPRRGIWCMGFVSGKTEGEVPVHDEREALTRLLKELEPIGRHLKPCTPPA